MHSFDLHLSLGHNCATRYQIERILRERLGNYPQKTHFFDWLWRNNGFTATHLAFAANFAISAEQLGLERVGPRYQVHHAGYGFYFLHDFSLSSKENPEDVAELEASMRREIPAFISKYEHLAESTRDALKNARNAALYFTGNLSTRQVLDFIETYSKSFQDNITIIHLADSSRGQRTISHPKVISRAFDQTSPVWSGVDSEWDSAIGDLFGN